MEKRKTLLFLCLLIVEFIGLSKETFAEFVHPGLLHTTEDLERIKSMVSVGKQPWYKAFESFAADPHSSLSYTMGGPDAVVTRDVNAGKTNAGVGHLAHDSVAALQLALMYFITEQESYAVLATRILEEWAETLMIINGMPIFIDILSE